jgi:hypothetical protein
MISRSYNVSLNPFKLCWVHEDEVYARVHFEVIMRTLIFEKNLIPWITKGNEKDERKCEEKYPRRSSDGRNDCLKMVSEER